MDLKLSPTHIAVAAGLLVVLLVLILLVLLVRRARTRARRRREQTDAALTASPPSEALAAPPTEPTPTHPPTFPAPPASIRPLPEPPDTGHSALDPPPRQRGPYRLVQDAGDRARPAPEPPGDPRSTADQERYRYPEPPQPRAAMEPTFDSPEHSGDYSPEFGRAPAGSGEPPARQEQPEHSATGWPRYPRADRDGPAGNGSGGGPNSGESDGGEPASGESVSRPSNGGREPGQEHDDRDSYRGRYEPEPATPAGVNGLAASAGHQPDGPEAETALAGASLTGASLTGASLTGASLTGASLTGASLTGASLTGAALPESALTGAALPESALAEAAGSGPGHDARDRLLRVLLADPARAVHAAGDLEASRTQLDRLNDSVHYQRRQLADAARRLRGAGLTPAQVAQLAGFGEGELVTLLAEHTPTPSPRPVGGAPESH
jgi:Pentapeptide repeats (8 copies)